ncbi:MAG: amino acid ABC transporter substrate-binding protein [Candidatus Omnitrophota bacterium]|jgi:branched-chain amino acid transport system substrate-binding protein|nr:MAG: amino acid ABC transporter substrate-binding protein [Candidatus Omnitrophota bacterium]
MVRKTSVFIFCILLIAFLSFSANAQSQNPQSIAIGALLPLTGSMSSQGELYATAVNMAIEDFNNYLNRTNSPYRIRVLIEDTATDPPQALQKLQQLAAEGIRYVVGPYTSACVAAVKAFADQNDIVIVSPESTAISLAIEDDNIFRLSPNDTLEANAIALYFNALGITQVIPIVVNDIFGQSLSTLTRQMIGRKGGTVAAPIFFEPSTTDFTQIVQNLSVQVEAAVAEVGVASVGVHIIGFEQTIDIFHQAKNYPILSQVRWCGSDAITKNQKLLEDAEAAAFAMQTQFASPMFAMEVISYPIAPTVSVVERIKRRLREASGQESDAFAICTYDGIWLGGLTSVNCAPSCDFETYKNTFQRMENIYIGYYGPPLLSAAGDRSMATYGFYTIREKEDVLKWELIATSFITMINFGELAIPNRNEALTVAALLPLSGSWSSQGQSSARVLEFAVEDINNYLAHEGSTLRVQVQIEDTQTNPAVALEKLQSIAAQNVSRIVIGPYTSANLQAVQQFANENNLLLISPSSTATSLAIPGDNIIRLVMNDAYQAKALATMMHSEKIKAVIPFVVNDVYGNDLLAAFKTYFEEMGGTVLDPILYDPATTDFAALVANLYEKVQNTVLQYGPFSVAVQLISFDEAADIFTAANQFDLLRSVRWFGCDANARFEAIRTNAETATFALQTEFTASTFSPEIDWIYPPGQGRSQQCYMENFYQRFYDTYGVGPTVYDYGTYDSLWLILWTYIGAGLDSPAFLLKPRLYATAAMTTGYCGQSTLNEAGDMKYGSYGFIQLYEKEGNYAWDYAAAYHYSLRHGEYLEYYLSTDPSFSKNWEIFQ